MPVLKLLSCQRAASTFICCLSSRLHVYDSEHSHRPPSRRNPLVPFRSTCLNHRPSSVMLPAKRTLQLFEVVKARGEVAVHGARLQAAPSMVSPTIKALVDAVWAVWSIGASIYDYIHTSAMEERIHALEKVISVHQFAIGLLLAAMLVLFTYIFVKKV